MEENREIIRICPTCGKEFVAVVINKKFCCAKCRNKYKLEEKRKNKTIFHKICPTCGKEFITNLSFQKFCCLECTTKFHNEETKASKKIYNRICPICGTKFSTTDARKKYCQAKCTSKAHKNFERDQRQARMKAVKKICPTCGKEFNPSIHNQVFCCKRCLNKAKYKDYKEKNKDMYEKICPVCGKHFTAIRKNTIYCSNKCARNGWKINNEDALKAYKKKYREENKEHISKHLKEYCKRHKDELRIKKCEYVKQRTKKDPIFRLKNLCRAMVRRCLANKKLYRSQIVLGYTPEDLRNHLETLFYNDMSWGNTNKWEIHHIRPLDTFNFLNYDGTDNYNTIKEANTLNNLIPLFKEDHKKLTDLYISEKKYLETAEDIMRYVNGENNA